MRRHRLGLRIAAPALAGLLQFGCAAGPSPDAGPSAPSGLPAPDPSTGFTRIVSGAGDSVGSVPGSADALYRYRFRQVDPASDRFTFQDRELSFYFKPTPDALHLQIENRQDQPVTIEWDRSTFLDPFGRSGSVAHATTRWADRFGSQPATEIAGLQRYGDYVLPLEYLVDPAGRPDQIHRQLLPEDASAPQFTDRVFGVDLVMMVEDRLRTYRFRFKVSSVIPR